MSFLCHESLELEHRDNVQGHKDSSYYSDQVVFDYVGSVSAQRFSCQVIVRYGGDGDFGRVHFGNQSFRDFCFNIKMVLIFDLRQQIF